MGRQIESDKAECYEMMNRGKRFSCLFRVVSRSLYLSIRLYYSLVPISISMCFIVELSFSNCRKSKGTEYGIMICTD